MKNDINNIKFNFKIWLETEDRKGILGDGQLELLKAINETGTLNKAMQKLNYSYRKSWDKLKKIEELLGFPVIQTHRGGVDKGNTTLTVYGKIIVEGFDKFHEKFDKVLTGACLNATSEIIKKLKDQASK